MAVVLARLWWGGSIHLQKVKQYRQCLLSFPDSSLQYSSCDPVSITHGLGLLLTQLVAPSVYSLHPNMFGILITSLH